MCGFLLTSDSSRMILFQKVMVKSRSGSASLPDPVALETEEQSLEREQNERYVLEAMGDCAAGMSVENVPAVVNIRTLKGRFIAHKFSTRWEMGVVKSVEKKQSVAGQFVLRVTQVLGTSCWCKRVNTVEKQ